MSGHLTFICFTQTVDQTELYKYLGKKASGADGGANARWKQVMDRVNACPTRAKSMQRAIAACRGKFQELMKLGIAYGNGRFDKGLSGRRFKLSVILPRLESLVNKIKQCVSDRTCVLRSFPMNNLSFPSTPTPNQHKTGNDETKEQNLLDKIAGEAHNNEMKAMAAEMAASSLGAVLNGHRKRKEREEEEKDGEEESKGSQEGKGEKGDGESEGSSQEGTGNGKDSKNGKGKGKGKTPGAARACKGRAEMAQYAAVSEALVEFGEKEARRMNK